MGNLINMCFVVCLDSRMYLTRERYVRFHFYVGTCKTWEELIMSFVDGVLLA